MHFPKSIYSRKNCDCHVLQDTIKQNKLKIPAKWKDMPSCRQLQQQKSFQLTVADAKNSELASYLKCQHFLSSCATSLKKTKVFYQMCAITCFCLIVGKMDIEICSSSFSQITSNHKFLRVWRDSVKCTEPRQCCQLILGSSQIFDIGSALIELRAVLNICFSTGSIVLFTAKTCCSCLQNFTFAQKKTYNHSVVIQKNSEVALL